MDIKMLKPVAGVKIRDPKTKDFLPEDGKRIEMSTYWNRRIQDGTVMVISENPQAKPERLKKGGDL